eukprot:Skav236536  [mRNA]  locus=scaffold1774:29730:33793:+ [translate_table: standard]
MRSVGDRSALHTGAVESSQFLAFQCEGMPPGEDAFPRADTDIIKSEDIVTALPVPRSSSEVVKPSELFLDLMMLDPLKTKEVSHKPSTHTEASKHTSKHLSPASRQSFAAVQPASQVPSAQMVAQTATDSKSIAVFFVCRVDQKGA